MGALSLHINEAHASISDQKLNICNSFTNSSKSRFFTHPPPSISTESTLIHKRTTAIDSAASKALRTNHPHLPTSPRLSGPKFLEAKNTISNLIDFPRVFIRSKRSWNHHFHTLPGLPCRSFSIFGQDLSWQRPIFEFSHFSPTPLTSPTHHLYLLATGPQQTYQGVGDDVRLLCRH